MSDVSTGALATFAGQLKAWRTKRAWTQAQLAKTLVCSPSLVSGIETMDRSPTADFAKRCDEAFDTPGTFTAMQELTAREAYPAYFAPVLGLEREATAIHAWELGAMPGLLQTEDYARALIRVSRPMDSAEAIDALVAARMERQKILSRPGLMLWYVLDEGILRHMTGGPAVMGRQLDTLIEAASTPGIVIQILRFTADHPGTDGTISVFDYTNAPTMCYTECYSGGRIVEANAEVKTLVTVMAMLRASALSPPESLDLIRQIRRDISE